MEKKNRPDRKKQEKQVRNAAQNPAQRLAKQRMQKDLQKKLLDSRQKAKNQLDTNEQSETPESEAVTNLEQFVEQTLLPPTVHSPSRATATKKFKSSSTSSAPASKTDVPPHNTKTTFSPTAPIRSSNIKSEPRIKTVHQNTSVNPAMKRWVQQRMIEQKQKMRVTTTKLKLQDLSLKHVEIQREDAPLLAHSPISINITTEHLPQTKAPVNRVPNTNWAHVMIQKQQAAFRLKYRPSNTNPKKEIYGAAQIPKTSLSSHTKWTSPVSIDTQITAAPIQQTSITSSSSHPFSSQTTASHSDGTILGNHTSSETTAKKTPKVNNQHLTTKSVQSSHSYAPQTNAKSSRMQHHQQLSHSAGRQRFFRDWQRRQHIAHVSQRAVPARSDVLAKAKIIIEKIRVLTTHTSALVISAIVLLTFLLLFGAVSGLVTSPFGVFFSSQETSPEARSVRAAITETNNEYFNELDNLVQNISHDTLIIRQIPQQATNDSQIHNWEEILSVFAVQTTTDPQGAMDVVKLDIKRIDKLKDIFWKMVSIEHETHTTGSGDKKKTTLTITITTKSAEQMANELHFSKVQKGALDELLANRAWLTELIGQATGSDSEHGGGDYEIPPEALGDEKFKAMITEAEKYLGYPYVWGGSSPSTSFDCSGFVSWVINKSGVGSVGRQTAQGLYNLSTPISRSQAKPGDLVYFTKTYNSKNPVTHIGIFVGDGKMIHCGNPIQYTSIETSYWKKHFYGFGRI